GTGKHPERGEGTSHTNPVGFPSPGLLAFARKPPSPSTGRGRKQGLPAQMQAVGSGCRFFTDESARPGNITTRPRPEDRMPTAAPQGIRRIAARLAADTDGQLLARFLDHRDEAASAALAWRHGPMVLRTCRRVIGNAADADDAFQATFVVLLRRAHSLACRACVGNFLYGVAFHTALKAKAMAAKRRTKEARARPPESEPDRSELLAALDEELARLPEMYREPVVLC